MILAFCALSPYLASICKVSFNSDVDVLVSFGTTPAIELFATDLRDSPLNVESGLFSADDNSRSSSFES